MFHRLTIPSYFGGLPSGFDYLNNPALSGGTGVPASMDGKKSGGPNDGTYAFAFGEDATSLFFNRSVKALGENTDTLDDILRRDLAITARTNDVLAVAPVSSISIVGEVFVAQLGTPNNQANRDLLISVLDDNDNEVVDSAGTKVVASSIVDDNISSTNLVGTQVSGFYTTPTVNFTPAIPAGTTYRVYYGERSSLAGLPLDAFTTIKIRGAQEVSAEVERVLMQLHASDATVWDAAWLTTINQLAVTGLDGRYRNRTGDPGSGHITDSGGSGADILRDGKAVEIVCPSSNWSFTGGFVNHLPDPVLACYRISTQFPSVDTNYDLNYGGDSGLVQESPYHSVFDANEGAASYVAGPVVLDMTCRNFQSNTLQGMPAISKITSSATALVNPDALSTSGARITVQVAAGDYISSGGIKGIRSTDLVELTEVSTGLVIGTYRFGSFVSPTRFQLRALSGATPPFPSGVSTQVRLRWLQPTMQLGGRYRDATGDTQAMPYFTIAAPSPAVTDWDTNRVDIHAAFLSAMIERQLSVSNALNYLSVAWGGYRRTGNWEAHGFLYGDGGIFTSGGRQQLNLLGSRAQSFTIDNVNAEVDIVWNPFNGGLVQISSDGALTNSPVVVFTIDASTGYVEIPGDKFDVYIEMEAGSTGVTSFVWPMNFVFSGGDGVVPTNNTTTSAIMTHYSFEYVQTASLTGWFATRTDF